MTKTRTVQRKEVLPVKGEDISVDTKVRVCPKCGGDIFDRELDSRTLEKAYDKYRVTHNVITPGEIEDLRKVYGLSQRSLGCLLGWGEVTIHRYEKGALPDEAHNLVLQFLTNPRNMMDVVDKWGARLSEQARTRLRKRIDSVLANEMPGRFLDSGHILNRTPGVLTGCRTFSASALQSMMVFFASQGGVLKTKLNKLLWYADLEHYRRYSVSISGATYIHITFGPVPDNYEWHLAAAITNGLVASREVPFPGGCRGEEIVCESEPRLSDLPESAIEVLRAVHRHFKGLGSKRISDLSHEEPGYKETQQGEPIPYSYAERLNIRIPVRQSARGRPSSSAK